MNFLKQSTAVTVITGPYLSPSDGLTALTALSTQAGRYVINGTGAAFTASSWAHDAGGHYLVGLSTTHTASAGKLRVSFSDGTTYVPVWEDFVVLPAAIYDWLFGGAAPLTPTVAGRTLDVSSTGEAGIDWANVGSPTTTVALTGTTVGVVTLTTTTTTATNVTTVNGLAPNVITAASIASDAGSEIADAVLSRSIATVEGTMPEHCLGTVVLAALEWGLSGTTWTLKRSDGSTTHATKTVSVTSGQITGVN